MKKYLTTSMTIDQIIAAMTAAKKEYGEVEYAGKKYILAEQAYVCNSPVCDGSTEYRARAYAIERDIMDYDVGGDLISHEVTWECIDSESDDESNACDWDNPIRVKKV